MRIQNFIIDRRKWQRGLDGSNGLALIKTSKKSVNTRLIRPIRVAIPAKTRIFTRLCDCKHAISRIHLLLNQDYMKAVFQNTIAGLLCLAGVVLAAPTQSMSHPKSIQNTQNPAINPANVIQDQPVTVCLETKPMPSIEEGTLRFACW